MRFSSLVNKNDATYKQIEDLTHLSKKVLQKNDKMDKKIVSTIQKILKMKERLVKQL